MLHCIVLSFCGAPFGSDLLLIADYSTPIPSGLSMGFFVFTCVCVSVSARMPARMRVHVCVYVREPLGIIGCMCVHAFVCMHVNIRVCVCVCTK